MGYFSDDHPNNCTEKTYPTTCDKCGQAVIYWRCWHGSRVFFNPLPFGGDHRLDCPSLAAAQPGPLKPSQLLLKKPLTKIESDKPSIEQEIRNLLADYEAEVKQQIEDFSNAASPPIRSEPLSEEVLQRRNKQDKDKVITSIPRSKSRSRNSNETMAGHPKAKQPDKKVEAPYLMRLLRRMFSVIGRKGRNS